MEEDQPKKRQKSAGTEQKQPQDAPPEARDDDVAAAEQMDTTEGKTDRAGEENETKEREEEQIPDAIKGKPECRIIVHNIGKRKNIGTITRSAVAFGCTQIIVVGQKKIGTHGHQNTRKYVRFEHFDDLQQARKHLKEHNFRIVGVEIGDGAKDVTKHPFQGNTCFIFGNEGTGLHKQAAAICDDLVYIPQYIPGTASLNVSVAASIVLHHFALWAQYTPNTWTDQKFCVDTSQQVETYMFSSSLAQKARLEQREERRAREAEAATTTSSSTTTTTTTTEAATTTTPTTPAATTTANNTTANNTTSTATAT